MLEHCKPHLLPDNVDTLAVELAEARAAFAAYLANTAESIDENELQIQWNLLNTALSRYPQGLRTLLAVSNGDIDAFLTNREALGLQVGSLVVDDSGRRIRFKWTSGPFTLTHEGMSAEFPEYTVKMTIVVDGHQFKFSSVEAYPTDPDSAYYADGYWHPHVSSSNVVCLGDINQPIRGLVASLEFDTIKMWVDQILSVYNENSPHHQLRYFVRGTCGVCKQEKTELSACEHCGIVRCQDCAVGSNCSACSTSCDHCGSVEVRTELKHVHTYKVLEDSIEPDEDKYVCRTCFEPLSTLMGRRREAMEAIAALTTETTEAPEETVPTPITIEEIPLDEINI